MHYFLMPGKFLWFESIFDTTYSVLHFFDSSNFFPLCKIYKIKICFYQEIFVFSNILDFQMIRRNRNPRHMTRDYKIKKYCQRLSTNAKRTSLSSLFVWIKQLILLFIINYYQSFWNQEERYFIFTEIKQFLVNPNKLLS